jgi:chromosome segregation ATPase
MNWKTGCVSWRTKEGEKAVTRYALQQVRTSNDRVLGLKTDVAAVSTSADNLAVEMTAATAALRSHGNLLNLLRQDVTALRQDNTQLRSDMERMHVEMDRRFDAVDARFNAVDARFDAVDARFEALERNVAAILAAVVPRNPAPGGA